MTKSPVDIAFTPAVKAAQERKNSRGIYERMQMGSVIDANLMAFIGEVRSFYFATASKEGQPYVQHRGGPPGFLRVLGDRKLGFADYRGNRQYISTGNLSENPQAFIFLMDYAHRQRIKIWGTARVVEDDDDLIKQLMPKDYRARAEQAILFEVEAWDVNCPQHIPQMFHASDVAILLEDRDAKIAKLEEELIALRAVK
jgi:hypothetical protein